MENLLFFLLLGGLAFLMMRGGGCGAHGHAGHGDHASTEPEGRVQSTGPGAAEAAGQIALVPDTDPVCGMKLAPDQGYGMMHDGRAQRFCSRDCLDAFEAEPDRYASAPPTETQPRRQDRGCCG